jgi:thiol-disulfide isomerase/thioredoxin
MFVFVPAQLLFLCAILLLSFPACAAKSAELDVVTLSGDHFNLVAKRGHWVIVNWWATWCAPCLKELRLLSEFVATHENVVAVGLTNEEISPSELREFVAANTVEYPVVLLDSILVPKSFPPTRFGIQVRPLTYLVSPGGTVVKRFTGGFSIDTLKQVMKEASN